eukprot:CAMPEP_0113957236 /NCGR_PEP_ID=MMETSP0011_2-20120614/2648_1 /TAXON_ID=101924 /ORGANISM="Rhodosorus marinus" /LENGTH=513 /DNA_ID=CAMNT_0000967757 /DNA_START=323 /DNA_END=1864 /DNA_ORIENTATION=+ /assembly_acc=CAM_ASM_000156
MTTREVTQFAAYRQGQMVSICDLDMGSGEGNENMEIMLLGYVINGSKRLKVEIGPLVEWCIEYGNDPTLWTHTARAWYKILSPSKEYQKVHELARRRFELCSRLFILAVTIMPEQCTYKSLVSVLAAPYKQMKGYSEKEILMESNFILDQADSLDDPSLRNTDFAKTLRQKAAQIAKEQKAEQKAEQKKQEKAAGSRKDNTAADKEKKERKKSSKPAAGFMWEPRSDDQVVRSALLKRCSKILNNLMKDKLAWWFLQPVDPVAHGCPNYLEVIKEPMDLGTVMARLSSGKAYENAEQVARDVRLIWSNCKRYNEPESELSLMASKLQAKFEEVIAREEDDVLKDPGKLVRSSSVASKRPAEERAEAGSPSDVDTEYGASTAERVKKGRTAKKAVATDFGDGGGLSRRLSERQMKLAERNDKPGTEEAVNDPNVFEPPPPTPTSATPKRYCIAKRCKRVAKGSSKYCGTSCVMVVAEARVKIMARVMTEEEILTVIRGSAHEIHKVVVDAGIKQ